MTLSKADIDLLFGPEPADSVESLLDAPITGEDISLAMQDPAFTPTQADYLKYEEYAKTKQTDWINTISQSVDAAANMIGGAISEGAQGAVINPLNYIEGAAQGTRQLYGLVAQSQDPSSPLFKFKDLVAGSGTVQSRYEQFLDARDFANRSARLESGQDFLAIQPEFTNPEFVQGVSMILDPTLALPGIGEVLGAGKLATRAVGKGAQLTGRAVAGAARPLERVAGAAERMTAEALGMAPEALRNTAATAGLAGALGIAPEAAAFAAIPAGIRTAREAGEALTRAGENLMTQPSRIGPLEAIGAAPGANLRQRMLGVVGQYGGDAALDASLRGLAGGIEGGVIGTGLGYLSGGEEGAAAGLGAGAVQGAAGAIGGRAYQKLTGKAAAEARAGDLGRFIDAQQDPTTKALFERVRDTHGVDTASALMDVEGLVKGRFGDVDVKYLSDTDFVDQYKGRARGVQVEIGDRPTIVINADILGKGKGDSPLYTLGHELFHALEKSEQLAGGATEIKNALVGRWIQEGDVIRKLSDGVFNDAEIEARFNEYRDKLSAGSPQRAAELAQFDTINKKADYIASELAAEHFAALIAGQKPDAMLKGFSGLTRQLLDAALTQNASKAIANAAASIERTFGVKPTDSVLFPDLKQASPQVNAMLRDLVRARRKLDEKIILDDSRGGRVLKPEDVSNPLAAKELVDLGLAEQMPDGSIRNLSSDEIRARDDKDLTSLRSITEKVPGARLVDGEITGRFSPEQLSAIEQSQTISSRMKDKIRAVNLAMENGNSLFVTYFAALKRVRNRLTGKDSPKYSSGIKVSEREFSPYSFWITKADNPVVRAIDITKVRNELSKLLKKDGNIGGLWNNTDGFMTDLARYFTNLDQKEGARRSADIFGVEKAKFLGDFVGAGEKTGSKFVRSFRLDRVGSMSPMDFKAKFSEEAYQLSKNRWMPAEKLGDKSVINSDEGYRIISGAKHKLYSPDGKLIGIYDTQTQAERKADATQARLQPEVDQQQRVPRNEVGQTAEAGGGDSALGRTQGREEGRQELGAVRQAGDVNVRFMPDQQGFYSKLEEVVTAKLPKVASPQQVLASVDPAKGSGVKPEELKWTGFAQAVERIAKENGGKVPKEKLIEHLNNEGSVNFEEVTLGTVWNNAVHSGYQLPGGENYREVVLTSDTAKPYTSSHYTDIENYVAHMRLNDRTATDGRSGLFIEEIQSDRHQEGRKRGYAGSGDVLPNGWTVEQVPTYTYRGGPQTGTEWVVFDATKTQVGLPASDKNEAIKNANGKKSLGVSDAPFQKTGDWSLQMFKRALRDAVASGKEWIGWTTGETQADRFNLRNQFDRIDVDRGQNDYFSVTAYDKSGNEVISNKEATSETLPSIVGEEFASKIIEKPPGNHVFEGVDLEVGGEGMRGFYDKILPTEIQKYVKQWGANVEKSNVPEANVWRVDITPEMRKSVSESGQPRFMPAGDMATGRGVKDHREAMDLFEKGYRLDGALSDGMEDPIRLKKASEIERFDPENLWAVPSKKIAAAISVRNMPASDADYLSAVKQGDTATAQRMVDEAAKAAGYTVGPVFHGRSTEFNTFKMPEKGERALFFSDSPEEANRFPMLRGRRPLDPVSAYLSGNLKQVKYPKDSEGSFLYDPDVMGKLLETARREGFDGVEIDGIQNFEGGPLSTTYAVFKPSQAKLADAVTENDSGNVIPLSQRFKATSEDIRFMPDYSGEHRAPQRDSGAPLDNLKGVYPDDVYGPNAARYYGHSSGDATDKAAARIIQATKGKPNAPVKVFRAIPKNIQSNDINPGDWITTIKSYAVQHGEGPLGGDYKILEKTVPAGDLYTNGDSIFEFGYDPKFMPSPDSAMPGAYTFTGGYRALPGKAKGSLRLYGPAGSLLGIASSLDEAQRIIRKKSKQ